MSYWQMNMLSYWVICIISFFLSIPLLLALLTFLAQELWFRTSSKPQWSPLSHDMVMKGSMLKSVSDR